MLNGEASRIASGVAGMPVGVSVVSLADIDAMPFGHTEQWHRFFRNHLSRLNIARKARS